MKFNTFAVENLLFIRIVRYLRINFDSCVNLVGRDYLRDVTNYEVHQAVHCHICIPLRELLSISRDSVVMAPNVIRTELLYLQGPNAVRQVLRQRLYLASREY